MNPNLAETATESGRLGGYLRDPRQERLIVAGRLEQINQIALDAEPGFVDVLDIDQKGQNRG